MLSSIVVTTSTDNNVAHAGFISLRDAVLTANTDAKNGISDVITFAAGLNGQALTLAATQGKLELGLGGAGSGVITIDGASQITISGNNATGVFVVDSGVRAVLTGLTVMAGNATFGGGLFNGGTVTVSNTTFLQNTASEGGGIINVGGTLTVSNSTFFQNSAMMAVVLRTAAAP